MITRDELIAIIKDIDDDIQKFPFTTNRTIKRIREAIKSISEEEKVCNFNSRCSARGERNACNNALFQCTYSSKPRKDL